MAFVQAVSEISEDTGDIHDLQITGVTAGNCLVAVISHTYMATPPTTLTVVTDNYTGSGAFTYVCNSGGGGYRIIAYVYPNAQAGTHNITVDYDLAVDVSMPWTVMEYGNVPSSSAVSASSDQTNGATTTPSTLQITTTDVTQTVISAILDTGGTTTIAPRDVGGLPTERVELGSQFQVQDYLVSTASNYTAGWTFGASHTSRAVAFALKYQAAAAAESLLLVPRRQLFVSRRIIQH